MSRPRPCPALHSAAPPGTHTLKLLLAARLRSPAPRAAPAPHPAALIDRIAAGPRQLPLLVVDDELVFFSSNAAAAYLFPVTDLSDNLLCQQMQEWEATRLFPAVSKLTSEPANVEIQNLVAALLNDLEKRLDGKKYILGDELSVADIIIWSTLFSAEKQIAHRSNLRRWYDSIAAESAVKEVLKEHSISAKAETSVLGVPQVAYTSPAGTPDDAPARAASADEIEAAKEGWANGARKLPALVRKEKVLLPVKGRRNILITSALPYVNNVPHLGNIIGCVLSADIFARYCRCMDYNTLFVCGTDEYGTATETKALEEKLTPRQICDKYFEIHNDVYRWFNIGFDYFGRTSTPEQTEITQRLFLILKDNGFLTTQSVDQLLCKNCDRFLADRFVEGTCPHPGCGYDGARGDQCDKCGKLVNATELIAARCKVCGDAPALTKSEQFYLELPQLEPALRSWFNLRESEWSGSARAVAKAWFRDGLRARCITRDLKWGVPVPVDGYREKVFYVWFDACIGYLSITKRYTERYEEWWKPAKDVDVKLYQFMAKDNVPFHCIIFPATLMGVNEGHVLVNSIFATEYLNYEDGKFSKSRGVGVFGTDARDTGIPADVWRFYLASIRPEGQDSSFSWVELGTRNNSELLNNLGNFCHRSLSFCAATFNGKIPAINPPAQHYELIALVNREIAAYIYNMERGKLREALRHVLSVSRLGNQYMQSEQPWVLLKGTADDKRRGETVIGLSCNLVALTCTMLAPYMPETSAKLAKQLNLAPDALRLNFDLPFLYQYLPAGHQIGKPEPLFTKIEPERLEELKKKYAGTQTERANRENGLSPPNASAAELEAEIAKQGEKVRQLKASTKDKAVWTPEVNRLLELKKQLAAAQKTPAPAAAQSVEQLTAAVAEQGEKVRQLKASTKEKAVWTPEVNRLLELKKLLAAAQKTPATAAAQTLEQLTAAVAEQGDKVRKLKASTKDKAVWTPEVNKLLELKKQLAALQIN